MPRHRGVYDPLKSEPYELSRSRIENFVKCPACFYLQQVEGVKFPSIPSYNINEATDVLLKRDFGEHRIAGTCHPFLKANGQVMDDVFIDDGLHLNDKGNRIWAAAIKAVLMKVEAQYEATAE